MDDEIIKDEGPEEEVLRLMTDYVVDQDTAEKALELIDEGLDEEEAIEIADEL